MDGRFFAFRPFNGKQKEIFLSALFASSAVKLLWPQHLFVFKFSVIGHFAQFKGQGLNLPGWVAIRFQLEKNTFNHRRRHLGNFESTWFIHYFPPDNNAARYTLCVYDFGGNMQKLSQSAAYNQNPFGPRSWRTAVMGLECNPLFAQMAFYLE